MEQLISLKNVPTLPWLPKRGKPLHLSTVYQWAKLGRRGRKLRVVYAHGGAATTEAWLLEFFGDGTSEPPRHERMPTEEQRRRSFEAAERELDEAGITPLGT